MLVWKFTIKTMSVIGGWHPTSEHVDPCSYNRTKGQAFTSRMVKRRLTLWSALLSEISIILEGSGRTIGRVFLLQGFWEQRCFCHWQKTEEPPL